MSSHSSPLPWIIRSKAPIGCTVVHPEDQFTYEVRSSTENQTLPVIVVAWPDGTEPEPPVLAAYDATAGETGGLRAMQSAIGEHAARSWPSLTVEVETLAFAEEAMECFSALFRAVVKRHHGNRGSAEDWTAAVRKETADAVLVLCNLATLEGFDLDDAVVARLAEVLGRDIDHDPIIVAADSEGTTRAVPAAEGDAS